MHLGAERPVLWNLAICATAVGKAEEAVDAWLEMGSRRPHRSRSRGMPYVAGLPPLLLRVLSRTPATDATSQLPGKAVGFELVWVAPAEPVPRGGAIAHVPRGADRLRRPRALGRRPGRGARHRSSRGRCRCSLCSRSCGDGGERRLAVRGPRAGAGGARRRWRRSSPRAPGSSSSRRGCSTHCAACAAGEPHAHHAASRRQRHTSAAATSTDLVRGKVIVPAASRSSTNFESPGKRPSERSCRRRSRFRSLYEQSSGTRSVRGRSTRPGAASRGRRCGRRRRRERERRARACPPSSTSSRTLPRLDEASDAGAPPAGVPGAVGARFSGRSRC